MRLTEGELLLYINTYPQFYTFDDNFVTLLTYTKKSRF